MPRIVIVILHYRHKPIPIECVISVVLGYFDENAFLHINYINRSNRTEGLTELSQAP
jgi:hypothetical protein